MIRLIILLVFILLVVVFVRSIFRGKNRPQNQGHNWIVSIIIGLLLMVMVVSGRLNWVLPLLGAVVALIIRSLPYILRYAPLIQRIWQQRKPFSRSSSDDNCSTVCTEYVRMRLYHESGEIDGEVLKGRYRGQKLQNLDQAEILAVLQDCRGRDDDATALIESYLDKVYGDEWRDSEHQKAEEKAHDNQMDEEEARRILGVSIDASHEEIINHHRRLIQKNHPDRGGSSYLAAKINQAKDILLGNC